jgi:hypothetical protein
MQIRFYDLQYVLQDFATNKIQARENTSNIISEMKDYQKNWLHHIHIIKTETISKQVLE